MGWLNNEREKINPQLFRLIGNGTYIENQRRCKVLIGPRLLEIYEKEEERR